jgi:hypothetical protein
MMDDVVYRIAKRQDEEVCISLSEFKDRKYLDVRVYFQPKDSDEMKPTKKGITLDVGLLSELRKGLATCEKRIASLQPINP